MSDKPKWLQDMKARDDKAMQDFIVKATKEQLYNLRFTDISADLAPLINKRAAELGISQIDLDLNRND